MAIPAQSTRRTASDWSSSYANGVFITDLFVIIWSVFGSQIAWFGLTEAKVSISGKLSVFAVSYTAVSIGICIAWLVALTITGSRDSRVVGIGTAEYRRVVNSSLMLFGLLAIGAYLLRIELARGYFITAFPIGLAALVVSRWAWRQYLTGQRARGRMSSLVVVVGSADSAAHYARELSAQPKAGYLVVGACIPSHDSSAELHALGVPVLGSLDDVTAALDSSGADTVVVTSSDELPPEKMRQLSWSLEPGRRHLVLAPGLIDIAGPRIHTRPVAGLSLIHVETPRYEGSRQATKRAFDTVSSLGLLVVLSVPLLLVAMAVRLGSAGPVFFRQERIGLNGKSFHMLKFRSMVINAEELLAELAARERAEGNAVMFKMAGDPRVTRVGAILRRFSIDELPQLINVFRGDMSLVGPRPPLPAEVEQYEQHINRRFLVKPGITGLWQVSGRSNLDWETTVRLDLYYVENWTLTGDLVILLRTVRAVLHRDGAY
jgi:exopolysaccharide biosynthesis polyprenyl glycosylphosphotransferase